MTVIIEEKINKNRQTERFECRVLEKEQGRITLYYVSEADAKIGDLSVPKGAFTIAHYVENRGYVLWRIFAPEGVLIGTLIHLSRNVAIDSCRVMWHDMILDIWVSPGGSVSILDEDELAECVAQALVSDEESTYIEKTKQKVIEDLDSILREAELWEFDQKRPVA